MIQFVWDDKKAEANWRKHGIQFEEAIEVFKDPLRETTLNCIENGEIRYQTIGSIGSHQLLLLIFTRFENGTTIIRIISARRLNKRERRKYEHG